MAIDIDKTLRILEVQLCQAIVWSEALEKISTLHQNEMSVHEGRFIFGSIYDALWDSLIVKICSIWDGKKGVVSLKKIEKEFKGRTNQEAINLSKKISSYTTSQESRLVTLKRWRDETIAHRATIFRKNGTYITEDEFDIEFPLHISVIKAELEHIEEILVATRKLQKQAPTAFQYLKEDAADEAEQFLKLWKLGVETQNKNELDAFMRKATQP